jgi:hypothetical protein
LAHLKQAPVLREAELESQELQGCRSGPQQHAVEITRPHELELEDVEAARPSLGNDPGDVRRTLPGHAPFRMAYRWPTR